MTDRGRGSRWALIVAAVALAIMLLLVTQQAAAAQAGRFVAGLWVSTMDVVIRLVGAVFGAG